MTVDCVFFEARNPDENLATFSSPGIPQIGSFIELDYPDKPNEMFLITCVHLRVGGHKVRACFVSGKRI